MSKRKKKHTLYLVFLSFQPFAVVGVLPSATASTYGKIEQQQRKQQIERKEKKR
jgi:hypothetical protein